MGKAHIFYIRDQALGQLPIGEVAIALFGHASPGSEMTLIDGDRLAARVSSHSSFHPV
jgi:hypothetical protein